MLIIIGFVGVFALGFWLGQESILSQEFKPIAIKQSTLTNVQEQSSNTLFNSLNNAANESNAFTEDGEYDNGNLNASDARSSLTPPSDPANPIALLEHLIALTNSENPKDIEQFSVYMDKLRDSLQDSPEHVQLLTNHFIDLPADSKQTYYIASLLQSASIANREEVLNQLVQRLAFDGTPQSNEKLLQLVSNIGVESSQTVIVEAVMNIALYADANDTNKLSALDLLMPYQLDSAQKLKVVDELRYALNNTEQEDKSYLVESIMRYSSAEERQNLASDLLLEENDFSTRVAIISSVHSGVLSPSSSLKESLFNIALNNNDALQAHARNALLYAFDINNSEYQLLQVNH